MFNGPRRFSGLPDVPALAEAAPGVSLPNAWQGLFAPRNLDANLVARIAKDVSEAQGAPAFIEKLPPGSQTYPAGPRELGAQMRADNERLGRLVAEIGLKAD